MDMSTDFLVGAGCGFLGGVTTALCWGWFIAGDRIERLEVELAGARAVLARYTEAADDRHAKASNEVRRMVSISNLRRQAHERIANLMSGNR